MYTCKRALHSMQRFVDSLIDSEQVALSRHLTSSLSLMVVVLGLVMEMIAYASLTERNLMRHTESVNH